MLTNRTNISKFTHVRPTNAKRHRNTEEIPESMLSKMLLCIHPTGAPSNKWPWSLWLPWAVFHYPRVCLQSHVAKLHLHLCQWKKFPSGNISRNQGKDVSNVLRSKEVTAGSQPHLPFSPTPAKKCLVFFPKDYPITLYRALRGSPWVVFGHVALPMTDKLVFWVTRAIPLPHLTAVKRGQGERDLRLPVETAPREYKNKQPWLLG